MSDPITLSLEQQFTLRSFVTQVERMDEVQTKEFLVNTYVRLMFLENHYKYSLKQRWGIDKAPTLQ